MTTLGPRRILYVEDDPDLRDLGKLALENGRVFEVDACACGSDAAARARAFIPDLIVLDVRMPGMDGLATLRCLREMDALASTPAVFMTAGTNDTELDALHAAGAAAIISKPFNIETLSRQIEEIWVKYHASDQ